MAGIRTAARAAAVVAALITVAGALPGGASDLVDHPRTLPCQGYSGVPAYNPVPAVMRDELTVRTFPTVQVGDGHGNIAWTRSPYGSHTWMLWLQSLRWIGALLNDYEQHGNEAALVHAELVVDDWIRDHPPGRPWTGQALDARAHRAQAMLCLLADVPRTDVMQRTMVVAALDQHARNLEDVYSGDNNHGLDENIALLSIGCTLGRASYTEFAVRRMTSSMRRTVDVQGVTNEQSTGYEAYNYSRFMMARDRAAACGVPLPADLVRRIDAMPAVIEAATLPDGTFVQIGDTERSSSGARVASSGPLTRVLRSGYVFTRSAWGPAASYGALRFGAARRIHGHDDHTSLTYFARGRLVVTDAGFTGYDNAGRFAYLRSAAASNQFLVTDVPTRLADTALTRSRVTLGATFAEVRDQPAVGVTRTRGVLLLTGPDLAVVWDRLDAPVTHRATQRWHVLPGTVTTVTTVTTGSGGRTVRLLPPGSSTRVDLIQVPLPAQAASRTTVVGGHYSAGLRQWQDAPVVETATRGRHLRLLTLLVPVARNARVSWSVSRSPGGTITVVIVTGTRRAVVAVSPDGGLRRVR
jgi:hypothetical protein